MALPIRAAERGWLPDWMVRAGIRSLLRARLHRERAAAQGDLAAARQRHLAAMSRGPIALVPTAANAQHYEVPAAFFERMLGPRLKYSCCWWGDGADTLADAEAAMLRLTSERAGVADGMRLLDLGCGWGAWALWAAATCPRSQVVAVSNSQAQRAFIEQQIARRNLHNLTVAAGDMNTFEPDGRFDRVVSVEMFEHMRNLEQLLARIASWLSPEGRLFAHVFCHRRYSYFFEDDGAGDWMARHFFTGGMMPAADLLFAFTRQMQVEAHWRVSGRDYQKTLLAWLDNLDAHRPEIERILAGHGPSTLGRLRAERWRIFLLACAELFGYDEGEEWFVSHYLMRPGGSESC